MTLHLRDAADSDDPFLKALYASTRSEELALTSWTDEQKDAFIQHQFAAQKRHYATVNPDATHHIICLDGEPVGRLYLARRPNRIHILDITVAPAKRNAGIGSAVLGEILKEAASAAKPASIYLESFNLSMRLFERLGFRSASVDGFLILMERPVAVSA